VSLALQVNIAHLWLPARLLCRDQGWALQEVLPIFKWILKKGDLKVIKKIKS
jgi:hypothetical protein